MIIYIVTVTDSSELRETIHSVWLDKAKAMAKAKKLEGPHTYSSVDDYEVRE